MFACWINSDTPLVLQTEEVADARWFIANDAVDEGRSRSA